MVFYTDGSAHPNPGPGGWGVVMTEGDQIVKKFTKQYGTSVTNNQMELEAVLFVMKNYGFNEKDEWFAYEPIVYCDSSYVVNTFTDWMFRWANNGWKNSSNKTPENLDLIQDYYRLYQQGYRIDLRKIAGHAGHEFNELADRLATGKEEGDVIWL